MHSFELYLIRPNFIKPEEALYLEDNIYNMDIQTEKLKLIELLLHTNNPSIIERVKKIFQTEESQDIWEELTTEQNIEIENAFKEVEDGQTISFEDFLENHK